MGESVDEHKILGQVFLHVHLEMFTFYIYILHFGGVQNSKFTLPRHNHGLVKSGCISVVTFQNLSNV